jgi:hypothetical protein
LIKSQMTIMTSPRLYSGAACARLSPRLILHTLL